MNAMRREFLHLLPNDAKTGAAGRATAKPTIPGHDYNMFWPPEQVAEFMSVVTDMLRDADIGDVGMAPGGNTN